MGLGSGGATFTITAEVSGWTLYPAQTPNTKAGSFRLTIDLPWVVTVSSDTGGYLMEYDASAGQYVPGGKRLEMPMNIIVDSSSSAPSYTGHEVDLSLGGILVEGQSDLNDIEIPFTCKQGVSWTDYVLPEGHDYRMSLTFTASSGG